MSKRLHSCVGLAALFVFCFLVINWIYGYVIACQIDSNDCFFVFGRRFLLRFLDHPGGLLRYAGRFLGQFYHYRWLGALLVSASITCFAVLFHRIQTEFGRHAHVCQTFFPCILLLALHTSSVYVIHDTLGLVASCGAFLGYSSCRGERLRRVYAFVATPIIYLLLGGYAWFFVIWVAACEWLDSPLRSDLPVKVVYVLFAIAMPLVAWRWGFPISLRSALAFPTIFVLPSRGGWLHHNPDPSDLAHHLSAYAQSCNLALVLSASLVLMPFWSRLCSGTRLAALWRPRHVRWQRVVLAIAFVVLAVSLHVLRYDPRLNTSVAYRQLYKRAQWDALIETAKQKRSKALVPQFMTNFALWHKGTLLDEMFSYPQVWGTRGLVFNLCLNPNPTQTWDDTYRAMYNSDLYYEMGHVNIAFRHAYNYMVWTRETYDALKRIAQCSMVNGNYAMAAKYLNVLERTLFHKGFARRYKAIIADPHAAEREFGELRERLPTVEAHRMTNQVLPLLVLHEAKPDNRMAFDYLMAGFLLDKRPASIARIRENIKHFKTAGHVSMPIHCQEALLLLEKREGTPIDLQGFNYDSATTARVKQFLQDLRQNPLQQLQAQYGHTYMFYFFCVATPADAQR